MSDSFSKFCHVVAHYGVVWSFKLTCAADHWLFVRSFLWFHILCERTVKALARLRGCARRLTLPTKWVCTQRRLRSAWAFAQYDQSLRCPLKKPWVFSYPLSAQWRLWSDWADAQADLSLRRAHTHYFGFVMSRLRLLDVQDDRIYFQQHVVLSILFRLFTKSGLFYIHVSHTGQNVKWGSLDRILLMAELCLEMIV